MSRQEEEFRETRRAVANSKLAEYKKKCWRLAFLARQGVVDKLAAVDLLFEIAAGHALICGLGEQRIQAILAEAFADADFHPMRVEVA
jgi:hypothetical protein